MCIRDSVTTWGIMAPPGTPANIVKKLNAALRSAASDPSVSNALKKGGYTPILQTVDEANAFMDAQIEAFK